MQGLPPFDKMYLDEPAGRASSHQCSRWTISLPVVPCVVCPAHCGVICGAAVAYVDRCYEHVFHLYHNLCGLWRNILFLCHNHFVDCKT